MLDDSDFDFALLVGATSDSGPIGCLVWLVIIAIIGFIVIGNHDECEKMKCPDGQTPSLLAHECLCVTKATK